MSNINKGTEEIIIHSSENTDIIPSYTQQSNNYQNYNDNHLEAPQNHRGIKSTNIKEGNTNNNVIDQVPKKKKREKENQLLLLLEL